MSLLLRETCISNCYTALNCNLLTLGIIHYLCKIDSTCLNVVPAFALNALWFALIYYLYSHEQIAQMCTALNIMYSNSECLRECQSL